MKKIFDNSLMIITGIILILILALAIYNRKPTIDDYNAIARPPAIKPDYTDIVIPANIAPLNFQLMEPSKSYLVKIYSAKGTPIEIFTRTGKIKIPVNKWNALLTQNRGEKLFFDIYTKSQNDKWSRYETINNTIAKEDIDSHIAYRLIRPIYNNWSDVGIYQRNLENYNEATILNGESCLNSCVNCHSFPANDPDSMFIATRNGKIGSSTILVQNGKPQKIGTKFGYTAWHPSGKLAVYSVNKVRQFFHNAGTQIRDVVDLDSALCYYKVDAQIAKTADEISQKDRLESYPTWSPDGKTLYFVSAHKPWGDEVKMPPPNYDKIKYDLMRVSYDIETDVWSKPETILTAEETGLSILLPRVSPDGKFLLFTMCDYGCFPVYRPSSDLYMMNLQTRQYHKLDINSQYSESWHSFSSNSRWIAFSSKRQGGLFTRTYFSYIDENGNAHKQFIMPQKDPLFYDSYIKTYSVPELITGEVKVKRNAIAKAVLSSDQVDIANIPITAATPKASTDDPWQERE